MNFRDANLNDIDELFELEQECFQNPFKKSDIENEIANNPVSKYVLLIEGERILGFVNFWITFDSATINQVCVTNSERKKGFGGLLLEKAIEIAKNEGCEFLTLEVRKSNIAAIKLYEKYGFLFVTTKAQYYENGEDALYYVKGLI